MRVRVRLGSRWGFALSQLTKLPQAWPPCPLPHPSHAPTPHAHAAATLRPTPVQGELLDAAASLVRPGGVLVYSICSIEVDEGPQQVGGGRAPHACAPTRRDL